MKTILNLSGTGANSLFKHMIILILPILIIVIFSGKGFSYPAWGSWVTKVQSGYTLEFRICTDVVNGGKAIFQAKITVSSNTFIYDYTVKVKEDDGLLGNPLRYEQTGGGNYYNGTFINLEGFTSSTCSESDKNMEIFLEFHYTTNGLLYTDITTSDANAANWDDDTYENNNSFSSSYSLGSNGAFGSLIMADDADWYKISVAAPYIDIKIDMYSFFNEAGNFNLYFYNSSQVLLKQSSGSSNQETISYTVPSAGTYYIKIVSADGGWGFYDLAITASPVEYTIATSSNPSNGGTTSGGGIFNAGSSCTVNATPTNSCYQFTNWTENGTVVSSNASYTFTVNANRNLEANFTAGNYTINTSSNPAAGGNTSGGGQKACGSSCTVTATPNACYQFANWTENGTVVSLNTSYTFTVNANRNLVANFTAGNYTINTSSNPAAGGNTSGGGQKACGSSCTLIATPNASYQFTNWTENGAVVSSNASYKFTVNGNRNLVANFSLINYCSITVSANPANGGTVSGCTQAECGSACTVTATPNACYRFTNWTENGTVISSNASFTVTLSGNRNLVANFTALNYTINTSSNPAAGGSTSGGGQKACGSICTVTATPNAGYNFINWTENGTAVSSNTNYTFTISSDRALVANFQISTVQYTISTSSNPSNGGTASGGGTYNSGTQVTVSAIPSNSCYQFTNWTENGNIVSLNSTYTFTVTANRNLVAIFSGRVYIMTVTPNGCGTVIGGGQINCGTSTNIIAVPGECCQFINWTEDGTVVSSNASFTTIVNGNRNLVANFTATNYTINISSSPVAGGSTSGGGQKACGSICTVTAIPNTGYNFVDWTENGIAISSSTSYTFAISSNRNLIANFLEDNIQCTLSVTPSNRPVAYIAGNTNFSVKSNCSWTTESDQTWCTVTPSGTGNGTITATYSANPTTSQRVANITVTVSGVTPYVVTVTQDPAVYCQTGFTDNFSADLSSWTDMNGNDWTIQNNELHSFYSLSQGSIYDNQADLMLNDQYQIDGNWKASIDFIRVADDAFPDYYQANGQFSLWLNSNQKIELIVGGGGDFWGGEQDSISFSVQEWNGTWALPSPVSTGKVKFTWNPDEWHTASIEKRGNKYSIFVDDACIAHYIDNFLNGQGKIGLHNYGTKKYDNFKIEPICCNQIFSDNFTESLSSWSDMNENDWTIQNNELHGFYSLSQGSIYDNQADLILNDQYQIAGNWKASIDFIRTADDYFSDYYQANAQFSLWLNSSQKVEIFVGGAGDFWGGIQDSISFSVQEWNGTWGPSAPVSTGKVKFTWNPDEWHTASIEKRGNVYSVFVDDACIAHYIDSFLNGQGKIGLHNYGTKRYDNFSLDTCSTSTIHVSVPYHKVAERDNVELVPNPFNVSTTIVIELNKSNKVSLAIYDSYGRLVKEIVSKQSFLAGKHEIDLSGIDLPSGMYVLEFKTKDSRIAKKIIKAQSIGW